MERVERRPFDPDQAVGASTEPDSRLPPEIEAAGNAIIGAAIEVHRALGPGFLERIYEEALVHELGLRGLHVEAQVEVVVPYKSIVIQGQRIDLLVNSCVIVELKCVERIADIHLAQLRSYLCSASCPLGLLLNFNSTLLKDGLRRVINSACLQEGRDSATRSPHHPACDHLHAEKAMPRLA